MIEGEESLRINLHNRLVENIAFRKGILNDIKLRDYLIGLSIFQGDSWSQRRITSQGQVKYANEQIQKQDSIENGSVNRIYNIAVLFM